MKLTEQANARSTIGQQKAAKNVVQEWVTDELQRQTERKDSKAKTGGEVAFAVGVSDWSTRC